MVWINMSLNFADARERRLEQKKKELTQEKEELLRQSKSRETIMDGVKAQIELLTKVLCISKKALEYGTDLSLSAQTATDIQKKVDDVVKPIPVPAT